MDQWAKDLGKKITIVKQTDRSGGGLDVYNNYADKAAKSRKLGGKIVGSNGAGNALIMLDKPLTGPYGASYTNFGPLGNVALEFRDEVEKARGQNRFFWLAVGQRSCLRVEEHSDSNEEKPAMKKSEKQSFFDMAKEDAADAAFRVAANKIAEGVKNLICLAISSKLEDSAHAATVEAFLNTPLGTAVVQSTAGYALTYAPKKISADPRVKRLAKEFRVSGMAAAGGIAVDQIMVHVVPLVENALSLLPEETDSKVRVTEHSSEMNVVPIHSSQEEEEEASTTEEKRMAANR